MTSAPNLERAVKDNAGKPKLALFPMRALQWAGKAFTFGASKYAPYNWAKGLPHSELMDATFRHLTDYWAGEDNDPQSGLPHLAHALCCVAMLLESKVRGIGEDDRWKWEAPVPTERASKPATKLAAPRCKHEGCIKPAMKHNLGAFGPFCRTHEKTNGDSWAFCVVGDCTRWVTRHCDRSFCSKHSHKNIEFLGGQHS